LIKKHIGSPTEVLIRQLNSKLRGWGYYYRGGYYSYTDADVADSRAWARSLFISRSAFRTPLSEQQSPAGPFDSGFFFASGVGPRFNDSPPAMPAVR
jgi:hypothetical protein